IHSAVSNYLWEDDLIKVPHSSSHHRALAPKAEFYDQQRLEREFGDSHSLSPYEVLHELISKAELSQIQRDVILMRASGLTLKEIGAKFEFSCEYIRRIESEAISIVQMANNIVA